MVKVAILGLGARGGITYSAFQSLEPELMQITALCDINQEKIDKYATEFNVPKENCFTDYNEFIKKDKIADILIVATQDRDHFSHTIPAIQKGYHILLEKPISPNLEECTKIEAEAKKHNRIVIVCHVLRYTEFFLQIKQIIKSGEIGEVRAINQIENVAYWHYAHSFVRGNWNNSEKTSPMILQKCCHDLDILQWLIGSKPVNISSEGGLEHFKRENAPEGATERCIQDCKAKNECPYNAERFYIEKFKNLPPERIKDDWITNVICEAYPSLERVEKALKYSDYGKCVYMSDNNVVDHQTVNIIFENNAIANLTMSAFTKDCFRQLKVFGTKGEIDADDRFNYVRVKPFNGEERIIDVGKICGDLSGHGGGDMQMMKQFLEVVENNKNETLNSEIEKSVMSHKMAFAAEYSRKNQGKVVDLENYK